MPRHPCTSCKKSVTTRQEALQCETCDQWTHRKCNTGISRPQYRRLVKGEEDLQFLCRNCDDNRPLLETVDIEGDYPVNLHGESLAEDPVEAPVNIPQPELEESLAEDPVEAPVNIPQPELEESIEERAVTEEDMEVDDDNPVFTVVDKGTQRAGLMLTDSRGFSFTKKNSRKETTYWWCSIRSKAMRCPATVIQKGQTFSDGKRPRCHPAKPGLQTAVEIVAKVKSTAKELVRDSARSVVEDVLKEVDVNAPEASRPNQHTLIRIANRTREKIRPKHPQNLDFEISYPYMPEDFIQRDVRVDGERHILMATTEQISLLATAKVWFVDGTFKVPDPYRWLEDPDAEETKAFVDAQNTVSKPYIDQCPVKDKLYNRIKEMWDYPKYSCPYKRGDNYYYYYNSGLQNQSVLYVQDSVDGEPRIFLDPNTLSEDGTVSLQRTAFSENGQYFAYGLSNSGSDWITIKVKKAPSGEDLPDVLKRVKFTSLTWTHDDKGFFYNRYPEQEGKSDGTETTSNLNQKLFYHRLGTDQSEDALVAEFPENPKWMIGVDVSDCGKYLVMAISQGCDPVNRLFYVDLSALAGGISGLLTYVKVVDNFDAEYEYITNTGTVFTFKTNLKAPRYKLINIDFSKPEMEHWTDLVAEDDKSVLEWTACVNNDRLIMCYLEDVKNRLFVYDLNSGSRLGQLPIDVGSVTGYSGKRKHTEIFYSFTSFLTPGIIYKCDMTQETYKSEVFRDIKVKNFDFNKFTTDQVFYTSKDGTKIPMFLVHCKDLEYNSNNPVMLYGYGGFNVPITPNFSVSRLAFIQHLGGVYAIANIRGGGEYGETWHKGGMLANKQNVFDDFQYAAKYLIDNKYTCQKRMAIIGGSNGGLLVGACMNQRPDLFGCVICHVGVMDMLKFHKFTIGHAWTTDFGCAEKKEEFDWLIKYSPLHNIKVPENNTQYPSILLLTGDHDDRVVPLHSLKFIAELQHVMKTCDKQTNPLMIRVDTKSGHGAGKPTTKLIEELSDVYSFVYQTLGLHWTD